MDEETKKRIADYFDPWDLVEYLGVSTMQIIEAFEEEYESRLEEIEDLIEFRRKHG